MFNLTGLEPANLTIFFIILAAAVIVLFLTRRLLKISFPYFFMGLVGLILGLLIGSLVATPLSNFSPKPSRPQNFSIKL